MSDSDVEIAAALELSREESQPVRTYYGGEVPNVHITSSLLTLQLNLSTEHIIYNFLSVIKYFFRMHSAELEWLNY
jgi:hypothetical protein